MFKHRRAARMDAYGTVNATTRELRDASLSSARGDRYMTSASAEAVGSWISGDCPTIARHRVSFGMLNLPPAGRTDACGVSEAQPSSLSRDASSALSEGTSETPHASVRAAGGSLSIPQVTRYHAMVAQSPDP